MEFKRGVQTGSELTHLDRFVTVEIDVYRVCVFFQLETDDAKRDHHSKTLAMNSPTLDAPDSSQSGPLDIIIHLGLKLNSSVFSQQQL